MSPAAFAGWISINNSILSSPYPCTSAERNGNRSHADLVPNKDLSWLSHLWIAYQERY